MQFIKSSFWSGLSVLGRSISAFLMAKIVALYYGPNGLTLLAHFQNFLALFTTLPVDGINMGVVKYLSEKKNDSLRRRDIFGTGIILNLVIFVSSCLAIIIFRRDFLSLFAGKINPLEWMLAMFVILLTQLVNFFFLSILLSQQRLKSYVLLNLSTYAVCICITYYVANNYGLSTALLAIGFGYGPLFFMGALLVIKRKHFAISYKHFFNQEMHKQLLSFGAMALSIMVFGRLVEFFMRQYVIVHFDLYQTGLWQSVVKFSDYYTNAFIAVIGMTYYPKISQLIHEQELLKKYVKQTLILFVPIIIAGLLFTYFLKENLLVWFFDVRFIKAAYLFKFQLLGDFLKLSSFILGYIVLAEARTKLFIISQAFSALLYIGLVLLCTHFWKLEGLTIAHFLRYVFYLGFLLLVYRKLLFSQMSQNHTNH